MEMIRFMILSLGDGFFELELYAKSPNPQVVAEATRSVFETSDFDLIPLAIEATLVAAGGSHWA
jgi:hypothetical protein